MTRTIALLFLFSISSYAHDTKIDPYISSVVSLGNWETTEQRGFYRFVTVSGGWEHVSSKLYVQWVSVSPEAQTLVAEVPIQELNHSYFNFQSPVCGKNCDSFNIKVSVRYPEGDKMFNIKTSSVGKYTLSELPL